MSTRLTKPQEALLQEIRESSTGGLWIKRYGRYYRTAHALHERGLVKIEDSYRGAEIFYVPAEGEKS